MPCISAFKTSRITANLLLSVAQFVITQWSIQQSFTFFSTPLLILYITQRGGVPEARTVAIAMIVH
jgi:hypothetical protein